MNASKVGRIGALTGVALLIASQVLATAASGADTRMLYVGDPAQATDQTNCTPPTNAGFTADFCISPAPVTTGSVTYFDADLANQGNQTLTAAWMGMGSDIALNNGQPGPDLPAGWTVAFVSQLDTPSGSTCAYDATGFRCDFGNLAMGAYAIVRVYLLAGPPPPAGSLVISGTVSENVGGNVGSNRNTYWASDQGGFASAATDGLVSGSFAGNSGNFKAEPQHVTNGLKSSIDLTGVEGDTLVTINETLDPGFECPKGVTCVSSYTAYASVNDGSAVSPYFTWHIEFPVDAKYKLSKKTALVHFSDDGTVIEVLYNVPEDSCSPLHLPCADFSLDTSGPVHYVIVDFKSRFNGFTKM